jgi:hypothetical protein
MSSPIIRLFNKLNPFNLQLVRVGRNILGVIESGTATNHEHDERRPTHPDWPPAQTKRKWIKSGECCFLSLSRSVKREPAQQQTSFQMSRV